MLWRRVSASFEKFAAVCSSELQGHHATINNRCFSVWRHAMYFTQFSEQLVYSIRWYRQLAPLSIHIERDSPSVFNRTYFDFRGRLKRWKKGDV